MWLSDCRSRGERGEQQTIAGKREVTQALRRTLLNDKLHQEPDRFDRAYAYAYIAQYY